MKYKTTLKRQNSKIYKKQSTKKKYRSRKKHGGSPKKRDDEKKSSKDEGNKSDAKQRYEYKNDDTKFLPPESKDIITSDSDESKGIDKDKEEISAVQDKAEEKNPLIDVDKIELTFDDIYIPDDPNFDKNIKEEDKANINKALVKINEHLN